MRIDKLRHFITAARKEGLANVVHTAYQIRKAKKAKLKKVGHCELTGLKPSFFDWLKGYGLEVHHIIPCHVRPDLACDEANLVVLVRSLHFIIGHIYNFKLWNPAVIVTVLSLREVFKRVAKVGKKVDETVNEFLTIPEAMEKGWLDAC